MAKNRTMRVAVLMLALTLITSCFVGGTFAKYTVGLTIGGGTEGGDNDGSSARVAKFGVDIVANTSGAEGAAQNIELFKKEYENNGQVVVRSDDYVIAPGTSNADTASADASAGTFGLTITGTPEVAVKVTYDAVISLSTGVTADGGNGPWEVNGEYYCPLIFTIGGVEYNGLDYDSLAEFETELSEAISFEGYFAPGTDLATALTGTATTVDRANLDISWEWPFQTSEENNVKDTALGNAAAEADASVGTDFELSFEISATVEQVEELPTETTAP